METTVDREGPPDEYTETDLGMSNFDHVIDPGFAEELQGNPYFGRHAGWSFNGLVWWDGEMFCEQAWCYRAIVATYRATTLELLMEIVNDEHGQH